MNLQINKGLTMHVGFALIATYMVLAPTKTIAQNIIEIPTYTVAQDIYKLERKVEALTVAKETYQTNQNILLLMLALSLIVNIKLSSKKEEVTQTQPA